LVIAAGLVLTTRTANATPAFARKYRTSCVTCHTVYPKLNPFGEAFRRNGFRFPGVDSDVIKEEPVSLGRDAYKKMFPNAVWPGTLAGSVPLALGFNGAVVVHPTSSSAGAEEDNGAVLVLNDLVEEAHLWAGGTIGNGISYFAELTGNGEEPIEIEHATMQFNDLVGPVHAANLLIGKGMAQLTSFGAHSTYLSDMAMPMTNEFALAGLDGDGWMLTENYKMAEINGTLQGRFSYSVGLNAGENDITRSPRNFYGHVGYKFGGVRLDGEKGSAVPNPMKPWAESAVTVDAFAYRSSTVFSGVRDKALVLGGQLRAQLDSLELDAGAIYEMHDNGGDAGAKANVLRQYDELSYVVYPWLVPALRFDLAQYAPDTGATATNMKISAGAAAIIRANIKMVLSLNLEHSSADLPPGGWEGIDALSAGEVNLDVESLTLGIAYAY